MWDALWINANLATMSAGSQGAAGYGVVRNGALGITDGRFTWVGPRADLPGEPGALARNTHDAGGRWITPGLIDCHTHLIWGGNRGAEFEQRLNGASYEEIAAAGGGILSTVRATRATSEEELTAGALPRARALLREGVTTLEIKSGYGLDTKTELRMLRAARRVGEKTGQRISPTLLAAHALPPEFAGRPDDYIELVCQEIIPAAADQGLAHAVDAFGERMAFSSQQVARVFAAAAGHGLRVKLHADQLSDQGGAALAARFAALSADHLEYAEQEGLENMAKSGAVAVLLPGAYYFLGQDKKPPVEALRRHGVAMAVATDCNPGSSPGASLLMMLNMACTLFGLTPAEALAGVTARAALALGVGHDRGRLETGLQADFALWDIDDPGQLAYAMGFNPCAGVAIAGAFSDFGEAQKLIEIVKAPE